MIFLQPKSHFDGKLSKLEKQSETCRNYAEGTPKSLLKKKSENKKNDMNDNNGSKFFVAVLKGTNLELTI